MQRSYEDSPLEEKCTLSCSQRNIKSQYIFPRSKVSTCKDQFKDPCATSSTSFVKWKSSLKSRTNYLAQQVSQTWESKVDNVIKQPLSWTITLSSTRFIEWRSSFEILKNNAIISDHLPKGIAQAFEDNIGRIIRQVL